jgi:hypothetical protein
VGLKGESASDKAPALPSVPLNGADDVEKVNARLEQAALITARALQEISGHWDAVYEAMRRGEQYGCPHIGTPGNRIPP